MYKPESFLIENVDPATADGWSRILKLHRVASSLASMSQIRGRINDGLVYYLQHAPGQDTDILANRLREVTGYGDYLASQAGMIAMGHLLRPSARPVNDPLEGRKTITADNAVSVIVNALNNLTQRSTLHDNVQQGLFDNSPNYDLNPERLILLGQAHTASLARITGQGQQPAA